LTLDIILVELFRGKGPTVILPKLTIINRSVCRPCHILVQSQEGTSESIDRGLVLKMQLFKFMRKGRGIDMIVPRLKPDNVETLMGMFDGSTMSSGGSRVAKYLHEHFTPTFSHELKKLHLQDETPIDALRTHQCFDVIRLQTGHNHINNGQVLGPAECICHTIGE
jgi:hypothetical protein